MGGSDAQPDHVSERLVWVSRHSRPVSDIARPETIRAALNAIASKLGCHADAVDVGESVWRDLAAPRRLSEAERQLAGALAAASGDEDLIRQVGQARVVAECGCGCLSVRLAADGPVIDSEALRRLSGSGREDHVSVSARCPGGAGGFVGVALHVVAGLVEELEVFAGEGVAVPLPPAAGLRDFAVS